MNGPLAAVALVWLAAPSLKVGDPAPALTVTTWPQGDPVKRFEPGKVYVVGFWATWCGSCIRHMPHLAALDVRYDGRRRSHSQAFHESSKEMAREPEKTT